MLRTMDQRGSATAELAVALPCVALLLAVVAAAGVAGRAQLGCQAAAWSATRLAARGEPLDRVQAAAQASAPPGARMDLHTSAETVTVTLTAELSLISGDARWRLPVRCASTAWREAAVPGGGP